MYFINHVSFGNICDIVMPIEHNKKALKMGRKVFPKNRLIIKTLVDKSRLSKKELYELLKIGRVTLWRWYRFGAGDIKTNYVVNILKGGNRNGSNRKSKNVRTRNDKLHGRRSKARRKNGRR